MRVKERQAEITNVNPRKENGEDGDVLASDISVHFVVEKDVVADLFPIENFIDQFFRGDDTTMEVVYPICYGQKIQDLKITLDIGLKPMVFEGAKIARNMKLTPQVGGYLEVECKLQVYPTATQSGKLDQAVKEFVKLTIESMTLDIGEVAPADDEAA